MIVSRTSGPKHTFSGFSESVAGFHRCLHIAEVSGWNGERDRVFDHARQQVDLFGVQIGWAGPLGKGGVVSERDGHLEHSMFVTLVT